MLLVLAHVGDEYFIPFRLRNLDAFAVQQHQHPFLAHAEAGSRNALVADLFHQVVIPSAAANRQLAVRRFGHDFKHGLGIVVQAADDPGIDAVRNAAAVQALLQLFEVLLALVAQQIQHAGCVLGQLLAVLFLAVQHPQRVPLKSFLAGGAHFVDPLAQEFLQPLMILRPAVRAADGVDFHAQVSDTQILQQMISRQDQLRVHGRFLRAEALHTELVVLPQAAVLRILITEMG